MTDEQIVLVGGLWLDASAWDGVVRRATRVGRRAVAVNLPGQGDGNTSATLDDQVAAVLAVVDAAPAGSVVVGHSASCALAWLIADARPSAVGRVVLIGGFPQADGDLYADFFPIETGRCPSPAGRPSRARTRPTSTTGRGRNSWPPPSRCPRASPGGPSG